MYGCRKMNPVALRKKGIAPLMMIEGYSIYYFKSNRFYWWSAPSFSAELVNKNIIYVYGHCEHPTLHMIREFVIEHLDGLIKEDLRSRGLAKQNHPTALIDLNDYSYVNTRRDICDEPSVRTMKYKIKSSRIERTYSTPYYGEISSRVIGMRAIGHDGRLVTIEPREDYGLRDRN